MAIYVKDQNDIIHLADTTGCGEFTFCGREFGCTIDGINNEFGEFPGEMVNGPANCVNCRKTINDMRQAIKNVRWSTKLKTEVNHD